MCYPIAAAEINLPGSVNTKRETNREFRRSSTVPFLPRLSQLGTIASAISDINAETDSHSVKSTNIIEQTDEYEANLGIHSDFALDCPEPSFASAPLFGARVQEMFLEYHALQLLIFLSFLISVGVFFIGITDIFRASIFVCCLLFALLWMIASLDRNLIAMLFHEFEYVYCLAMLVVFLVAAVTQTPRTSIALAKYRNTDYSITVFGSMAGEILWLIGSLLIITYVSMHRSLL